MKIVKSFVMFLAISTMVAVTSCSKEESNQSINEDQISKLLVFKRQFSANASAQQRLVTNAEGKFIIVNWEEWGRASRQCRGWGLCNANWFYCADENNNQVNCFRSINGYSAPLQQDDLTEEYYLEILLDEATTLPDDLLTLKIDEDIPLDTALVIGRDLVFKQGSYYFDSSLGDYGGIKIILE